MINKNYAILISFLLVSANAQAMLDLKNARPFDVVLGDEKETELKALKLELETFEKNEKKASEDIAIKKNQVEAEISTLESQQKVQGEDDFTNKKILLLRSYNQDLANAKAIWKEVIVTTNEHIALLEALVKEKNQFSHDLNFEKKSFYTIQDLQSLTEIIATLDDKISELNLKEGQTKLDLDDRKKKFALSERALREKIKEQAAFPSEKNYEQLFDVHQQAELLDLEVKFKKQEKELNSLRVQEKSTQLGLITSKLYIEEKKQDMLKNKRDAMVKMSFRVDKKDVDTARTDLEKKKRYYLTITDNYLKKIEKLLVEQGQLKESFKLRLEAEQKIFANAGIHLDEWTGKPISIEDYSAMSEIGYKNDKNFLMGLEVELLHTQIDFEKAHYESEDTTASIIYTWYKIKHQLFKNSEELSAEVKEYESQIDELNRERLVYEDKRRAAISSLDLRNKARINLKEIISKFDEQKNILFSHQEQRYLKIRNFFDDAQKQLGKQIEITSKLTENYSKILVALNGMARQVSAMLIELQRVSLWQRSGGAISRSGLANSIPDIFTFFEDLMVLGREYFGGFTFAYIGQSILYTVRRPFDLLFFIIKLLLLILLFSLTRTYIPKIGRILFIVTKESIGQYTASRLLAALLLFIAHYFTSLFLWSFCFGLCSFYTGSEIYPLILFYLFSIPYLLFIAHKLVNYLLNFNIHHEHLFFAHTFQGHFFKIVRALFFATIILLCFREAFLLGSYIKSELPDILLAVYGVVIRVLILALPRKEDLLNALPTKTPFFARLWRIIDRYYTIIFFVGVLLIVMSDPHVGGYNNLIFYLLWGMLGTVVIIKVLFSFYMFCRRNSATILFFSDGESLRERFSFAKTFYGISIIFLFCTFIFTAVLLIAWLWGKPISLGNFSDFMMVERLTIDMGNGVYKKLTLLGLMGTFAIIPVGFFVGFIVDRFVLYRIFSVLLVNPGVHNAVSTISYYITVITVITLGLWQQGLGFLVLYYLGPLLFGMAWALRDLLNDFVSYFIILINRPIKVGDYIKINDEIQGAVRSITPRSVVLRRNRGFCLIVPNHKIIQEVVTNWDYNLSYICCPDIIVMIPITNNPDEVFKVLKLAAEENINVLKTPFPMVRLESFEELGFQFLVRCYISPEKTLDQWEIASSVRFNIIRKLRENSMDIAVPVRIFQERLASKP